MRKYVFTVVFVLLFATGIVAYADSAGMIGQSVDSTYPVYVNGQQAPMDAIVINGVSYLPTRYVAESAGYTVTFKDNQIYLDKPTTTSTTSPTPNNSTSSTQTPAPETTSTTVTTSTTPNVTKTQSAQTNGGVNKVQYYKVKLTGLDTGRGPDETFMYQVLDGEGYLAHSAFGRYVDWDGTKTTITLPGAGTVSVPAGSKYEPGVNGFEQYGYTFIKLSALGLKPTISGDVITLSQ